MYRTSSNLSDFEDNNKVLSTKSKIVMLAKVDLFAECLMQAVGARFQGQDVVSLSDPESLLDGNLVDVRLVMLYRLPVATFPSVLRMVHEVHPKAAIGLVVEDADALDSSIAGFVDEGLIHGVLPLNLHLDVCLTVIDLLMKGGEHFPAALLRHLAPVRLTGEALRVGREAVVEAFVAPEPKRDAGMGVLTARDVMIAGSADGDQIDVDTPVQTILQQIGAHALSVTENGQPIGRITQSSLIKRLAPT